MTGGLNELTGFLEKKRIAYWIDSGVLLGMLREGRFLDWEKDIDLGIMDHDLQKLLQVLPELQSMGYRTVINTYLGTVFTVGLKPGDPGRKLDAAIHVYYPVGRNLWSPQTQLYMPPPAPDVYPGQRSRTGEYLRRFVERAYYHKEKKHNQAGQETNRLRKQGLLYRISRLIYNRIDRGIMAEIWPIREIYVPLTWVVPIELILPLKTLRVNNYSFSVPGQAEKYLTYRYGQWRRPVTDWFYWRDDGAVLRERPHQVRRRLQSKTK